MSPTRLAALALAQAPALCLAQGGRTGVFAADRANAAIIEYRVGGGIATNVLASGPPLVEPSALLSMGQLLVADAATDAVFLYDPSTGAFLGTLVSRGSGGLRGPVAMDYEHWSGRELFVLNGGDGSVRRYDLSTGAFLGLAVKGRGPASSLRVEPPRRHGEPPTGLIAYSLAGEVVRFDLRTGEPIETLGDGIESPRGLSALQWVGYVVAEDRADPNLPDRVLVLNPGHPPTEHFTLPPGLTPLWVGEQVSLQYHVGTSGGLLRYGRAGPPSAFFPVSPGHTPAAYASSGQCYADCDTSTGVAVIDIFDFLTFMQRWNLGVAWACDCDTSTGAGVCDIFDYLCFMDFYDFGCP